VEPAVPQEMDQAPCIDAVGLSKTFGRRRVLRDVDLRVGSGEIHGLVGPNGSGKSTVIKILAGFHEPDVGAQIFVHGKSVDLPMAPGAPRDLGLAFVHQDLGLIEDASVVENVKIGLYDTRRGYRVSWRAERREVRAACRELGVDISPDALIVTLPQVERALVALVRAVIGLRRVDGALLVLDEPTAYLPQDGVDRLFRTVREIAKTGVGVLFVSHRLDEILELTDSVTVLRDGVRVALHQTSKISEDELVESILGFAADRLYPSHDERKGATVLRAREVSGAGLEPFSIDLSEGEILGATGMLGAGYEVLPYVLFGDRSASGQLELGDSVFPLHSMSPRKSREAGIALLPANRISDSGLQEALVSENLTLPTLGSFYRRGVLRHRSELVEVKSELTRYDVRPPIASLPLAALSGGNQQKVLFAKWLRTDPRVLLLHEPTSGVDVGARTQIFSVIREFADRGAAILIASGEHADLAGLCDRVMVFRRGRIADVLSGAGLTEDALLATAFQTDQAVEPKGSADDQGKGGTADRGLEGKT
jgi:ribose transport system ATP-binding protein